jgi:hypothetical protein
LAPEGLLERQYFYEKSFRCEHCKVRQGNHLAAQKKKIFRTRRRPFRSQQVAARVAAGDEIAAFRAFELIVSCGALLQPKKLLSAGHRSKHFAAVLGAAEPRGPRPSP